MAMSLTECLDKARWDRFVNASPQGNVFCLTPLLDALGEEYRLLFVEERDEAQLGIVLILRDGQPVRAPYPFTMYQGALFNRAVSELPPHSRAKHGLEITDFLVTQLEQRFDRISLCLHHRFPDLRSFSWFHYHDPHRGRFQIDLRYSALLDLSLVTDFDRYLTSIRNLRLREYRRARSAQYRAEPSTDVETLDRLHNLTFDRQRLQRDEHDVRLLRAISRAALDNSFGELLICKDSHDTTASATLFLYDQRCAYYLIGANDPDHRPSGCGTYLMLENISRCRERGISTLDFVGANSPNRGDFKTSFNAVPVPYFMVTWEKPVSVCKEESN
jgi:GNAT superfamily N-acetyltransferase